MLVLSRWRQEDQKSVGILRSKPVQGQPGQYETLSQKFKGEGRGRKSERD